MTINVGDRLPDVPLAIATADGPQPTTSGDYFAGKKVALFAVPGAFTPTCSARHLPSYVDKAADIKGKGVDEIACISVNDPFVMKHWGEVAGADGQVTMMPDGNAAFTRAIGLEMDGSGHGLGVRSKRYSMVVDHGTVVDLEVEDAPGEVTISGAEACLARLG